MKASFAEPAQVMELDIAFHEAIGAMSRNPLFALLVAAFRVVTRQTWGLGWASRPNDTERLESVNGHAVIAAAIRTATPRLPKRQWPTISISGRKALIRAGVV